MSAIQFIDAFIEPYAVRKGDYNLAEFLILTSDDSNKEIALKSGISKARIAPLRKQLRQRR